MMSIGTIRYNVITKYYYTALKSKRMKLSKIIFPLLLCVLIMGSSCNTSRKAYRPTKRKNKDCDNCSKWSYHNEIITKSYKV
jgi:hypothetical protein